MIEKRIIAVERKAELVDVILDHVDIESISPRNIEILKMYSRGATLQGIGDEFGITRERVRQIIFRYSTCEPGKSATPEISNRQRELSAYISDMGFTRTHLAKKIDVPYASLSEMLRLNSPMPDDVYDRLSKFVKFEQTAQIESGEAS